MKKCFKYILFLSIAFLSLTGTVYADMKDYKYYCDYDLNLRRENNLNSVLTSPVRIYVYNNTAKLYSNVSEIRQRSLMDNVDPDLDEKEIISGKVCNGYDYDLNGNIMVCDNSIPVIYDSDSLYNASVFNSNYTCPDITVKTGKDQNGNDSYSLIFGNTELSGNGFITSKSKNNPSDTMNSNLSSEEKKQIISGEVNQGKTCEVAIIPNSVEGISNDYDYKVILKINSLGQKIIAMGFRKDGTNDFEITSGVIYEGSKDVRINILGRNFTFKEGLTDFFFKQTNAQQSSNDFTCPAKSIIIDESKLSNNSYEYILGDEETVKSNGKGNAKNLTDDLSVLDGDNSLNIEIQPFIKENDTCKKMLGDTLVGYLQTAYTIIKIGVIVIVIVMAMLDFANNVITGKDEVQKVALKWGKRLVIVIVILLLPAIIDMIGNALGYKDIICGIR